MRRISIIHNGFHGRTHLAFLATCDGFGQAFVSPRVGKRLNREVCGLAGCACGEYVAAPQGWDRDPWTVRLPMDGADMRGEHPQV